MLIYFSYERPSSKGEKMNTVRTAQQTINKFERFNSGPGGVVLLAITLFAVMIGFLLITFGSVLRW